MDWLNDLLQSPQLAAGLILVVPVIVALVELFKGLGLPSRWAPLVAVALGMVFSLTALVAARYPGAGAWIGAVALGLILGLAAAGLYSGQKAVRGG